MIRPSLITGPSVMLYGGQVLAEVDTRASVDGTHRKVVDILRPGRAALCVCVECDRLWAEGEVSLPECRR